MSADVTFEETPFFSSLMQDFNFVQQVLPVPSLDPLMSLVHELPIWTQVKPPLQPAFPAFFIASLYSPI